MMDKLGAIAEVERLVAVLKLWTSKIDKVPHCRHFYRNELPTNARTHGVDLLELIQAAQAVAKLNIPPVESRVNPCVVASELLDLLTPCDDDLATIDDGLREIGTLLEHGSVVELWKLSGENRNTPKPRPQRLSINARMMETIQRNTEAMGWSTRQWKEHLKCKSRSSISDTETWKSLQSVRLSEKAKRMVDRRRKPKASDTKRD